MAFINSAARKRAVVMSISFLLPVLAWSQVSRSSGLLQGTVFDRTGSVVAGAHVQVTNIATKQARTGSTDAAGRFQFAEMAVGTYELKIESPGFAPYSNDLVVVNVGNITGLSVRLVPATVEQNVTVSAETAAADVVQTTVATSVGPERIEESPVVSRSYIHFVLLAPSLSQSNKTQSGAASSVLADSGFTFAGLRARSNSLYIDGVENNDEFEGSVRTELSPETVHDFQVVNNGISAESGGGAGGSINVVTKSGANSPHGDAFLFIQNGVLNAREPLTNETTQPELSRQRVGLALGGPIRLNRTFYYIAGEQERSRGDDSSLISKPVASSIGGLLAAGAFPRLATRQLDPGTFRVTRAETEASGRLDHQINGNSSLLLKYAFTNNREVGDAFNLGGLVDPSARGSSFTRDQGVTAGVNSVLSPSSVNTANVQISTRRQVLTTGDRTGPGIDIAGVAEFGRPYAGNNRRKEDHYEAADAVSMLRGRHLLKLGVDIDRIHESASVEDGFGAYYIFPSFRAFALGAPDEYLQSWGIPQTKFSVTKYAGFVQDRWTSKRITVDAGLRYDFEDLPSGVPQDTDNIAPRLGIAFSPSDAWVLRAGFGLFYDRYLLAALNRQLEWNGTTAFQQVAYGAQASQIFSAAFGGTPVIAPAAIPPSLFTTARRLSTPYAEIASAGVQRTITPNLTLTGTYLFTHGVKLPRTLNVNLAPPTTLAPTNATQLGFSTPLPQQLGRPVFANRLNPKLGNVYEWQDQSSSTYNGVSIALDRRLSNEIEFSGSYTLSKTLDDASDFDQQPQNPYSIRAERAVSLNDQRHRFVFSGTFDLPFGEEEQGENRGGLIAKLFNNIEAAPIVMVGSGRPINPLAGFDANRNGAFPLSARPLHLARNTLRTPNRVELDLRVLKFFKIGEHGKLDFVAECFNLLNHTNVTELNQFFGPGTIPISTFNTPDRADIARQLQFSVDFEF